ncbi:MAG: TatD family hydrolase [Minisyncoccota bacterium]
MYDIHTHLFWRDYDDDRDEVVRRAREAGVSRMICVGTSPEDNAQAVQMAENYTEVYASVGLHPDFLDTLTDEANVTYFVQNLSSLVSHPKVIAIGECGLDYFTRGEEFPTSNQRKELQKYGWCAQLRLALEWHLPVIVHCRPTFGTMDAYEDLLMILENLYTTVRKMVPIVLHCYQGNVDITRRFLRLAPVFFSFTGTITYPIKKALAGTENDPEIVVSLIPLTRIFVETDCPFLAPQEKRGERNEPAYVMSIAETVCRFKQCSLADFNQAVTQSFAHVFAKAVL